MTRKIRIMLPSEIAEELVAERLAVRPLLTRGPELGEIVKVGVEAVNTGAAVVSIALAADTCRKIATAFLRGRSKSQDEIVITISTAKGKVSRTFSTDVSAQDRILEFLLENL